MRQHVPSEELDLLVSAIAPELEHHMRAPGLAVFLDRGDAVAGVPAIGLHLSRISSVTFAFAARRPPCSIASATGRISSCEPGEVEQGVCRPLDVRTLFARYMPAISRAPSRPGVASVA
jgi:hypothetical protein